MARFVDHLGGRDLVADLGCGPGDDLSRLAAMGVTAIGLDRSVELLRLAGNRLRVRGDLRVLPFGECSLGGIWSHASLVHVDARDLPATIAEWDRVLRGYSSSPTSRPERSSPATGRQCERSGGRSARRSEPSASRCSWAMMPMPFFHNANQRRGAIGHDRPLPTTSRPGHRSWPLRPVAGRGRPQRSVPAADTGHARRRVGARLLGGPLLLGAPVLPAVPHTAGRHPNRRAAG